MKIYQNKHHKKLPRPFYGSGQSDGRMDRTKDEWKPLVKRRGGLRRKVPAPAVPLRKKPPHRRIVPCAVYI